MADVNVIASRALNTRAIWRGSGDSCSSWMLSVGPLVSSISEADVPVLPRSGVRRAIRFRAVPVRRVLFHILCRPAQTHRAGVARRRRVWLADHRTGEGELLPGCPTLSCLRSRGVMLTCAVMSWSPKLTYVSLLRNA